MMRKDMTVRHCILCFLKRSSGGKRHGRNCAKWFLAVATSRCVTQIMGAKCNLMLLPIDLTSLAVSN